MNLIGIMMSSLFIGCWIVLWDMVTVEVIHKMAQYSQPVQQQPGIFSSQF